MDCSPPGSSVHGIPQTRILKWVAISYSSIYMYASLLDFLPIQVTTEHWVEIPVLKSMFSSVIYFMYTINSVCILVTLHPESQHGSICHFGIKFYFFFFLIFYIFCWNCRALPKHLLTLILFAETPSELICCWPRRGWGAGKPSCSLHCAWWSWACWAVWPSRCACPQFSQGSAVLSSPPACDHSSHWRKTWFLLLGERRECLYGVKPPTALPESTQPIRAVSYPPPCPHLLSPLDKKQPQHSPFLSGLALSHPWCPEPSLLLSRVCLAGFLTGFAFAFVF